MSKLLSLVKMESPSSPMVSRLSEISVPERFYNRLRTGFWTLDCLFGGQNMPGILPGACYMVTGTSGAGKSTLMQFLAGILESQGQRVLYNAGEESREMIALRSETRPAQGDFSLGTFSQVEDLLAEAHNFDVIMVDSLQTLGSRHENLSGNRLLDYIMRQLYALSKEENGPTVFVVCQSTKGKGAVYQGPKSLAHIVDGHLHLCRERDGKRFVEFAEKHRFGPIGIPYEYVLGPSGLELIGPEEDEIEISDEDILE